MSEFDDKRWLYFHIMCKCPIGVPTDNCPLNEVRKPSVLENYIYASKVIKQNIVDEVIAYHCDCMNERRHNTIFEKNTGI